LFGVATVQLETLVMQRCGGRYLESQDNTSKFWHRVLGTKPNCFGDYNEKRHKCGTFSYHECHVIDECMLRKWKKDKEG